MKMPRIKAFGKKKFSGNIYTRHKNYQNRPNLETLETVSNPATSPTYERSSSSKKLKYIGMMGKNSDYLAEEFEGGNIIIDLKILSNQICCNVICRKCNAIGSMKLFEDTTKRQGIFSNLALSCSECSTKTSFMSSQRTETMHFENNLRFVYGLRSIGKGHDAAETFCSVMNLPPPPSRFCKYNKRVAY